MYGGRDYTPPRVGGVALCSSEATGQGRRGIGNARTRDNGEGEREIMERESAFLTDNGPAGQKRTATGRADGGFEPGGRLSRG